MTTGTLRICGTPIGNLGDVTQRLRETLADAAVIACEDTRRTRALLTALEIPAPKLERLDANTEERGAARLVERLLQGDDVALVTDAGMPAVSDPGTRLVLAAAAAGVVVEVIPGPSAVTAAFAASGIEGDGFAFIGFLPRTAGGLNARLDAADAWGVPLIAFEAPGRLPRTLATLAAREPERRIVVCRELTKLHEQVVARHRRRAGRPVQRAAARRGDARPRRRRTPPGRRAVGEPVARRPRPAARFRPRRASRVGDRSAALRASPTRAVRAPDRRITVARAAAVAAGRLPPIARNARCNWSSPPAPPRPSAAAGTLSPPVPCVRELLRHDPHLLRQREPASRARVHDHCGRRGEPSHAAAGRGRLLPDRH